LGPAAWARCTARDTRLGRDVAVKVLPADVARDADRRARFEREAHAVAALSHPNILALFDIGLDGDTLFVVTELLDGETLADRLRQGALPVRKAVDIAVAIARGLGAAHEKGIAHRDLKPANIFLLADGQVKILDFGLAKLQDPKTPRPQDPKTSRPQDLKTSAPRPPSRLRNRPREASSWGQPGTWRRSRFAASRWTVARTSSPSAWCSTRCSPARAPSRVRRRRRR